MDHHDVEAVAPDHLDALPLPEEDSVSHAVEEQPRSFFSRRKKAIAAVASIVLVGGIGIGVALSMNSNKQPLDQNGVMQTNPAEEMIDAEPSDGSSTEPLDESSTKPLDQSSGEPLNDETPHEIPWEEDLVDDEELDIIIDVGSDAEYPEDIILDGGYEQREPTYDEEDALPPELIDAEKVEFNSEDFTIDAAVFDGPITDFIVTPDVSRITVTTSSTCPNANEGLWKMTLETDNYPWETYWELLDRQDNVVASGPPKGRNYARSTKYIGQMCFRAGPYKLRLGDKNKDGFCCKYGRGNMEVKVNGQTVASQKGNESFEEKTFSFPIRAVGNGNNKPSPTPQPTRKPTVRPTNEPTEKLGENQVDCKNVAVKVVNDRFAGETSYKLTPVNQPNKAILERKPESMKSKTTYKDSACVKDGRYRLTVTDPFQGIQEGGYYSVSIDGEDVMYGDTFQGGSESHIIHVGYKPPMTARERMWLDEHNSRREEFHKEKGKKYNKLVWSPQLAEEASNWVDEITPNCKITRQPGLVEGENMSARASGGPRDEGPNPILTRWANNKKNAGYPTNQSLTQVLWRGSRYVGCSEKAVQRQNGNWCYVTICRYARAGNCAMGKYKDWETAALADRTQCGPICVAGVCY